MIATMEVPQSPITPQAAAAELLRRRAARQSLLAFTEYTKEDYKANWHHRLIADRLDRVVSGEIKRLMIFTAPQHGKSELVSRRFPAYLLGRNPSLRLIGCSHTADLAISMNRDTQRIIESDPYRRLFPQTRLNSKWVRGSSRSDARRTLDVFEIVRHRGGLRSAGVGGSIAGNPADIGLIDDPFGKREDAESPTIRQRIWDWYANDFYTRLSTDAAIVLTHTRWHRDDLAGRLLLKMMDRSGDQWDILELPAIKTEKQTCVDDLRQPGEPLWPSFKSLEDLETIRNQDRGAFAALYQQDPAETGGSEWPISYFGDWIWCKPQDWPSNDKFRLRIITCDPSKGKSDKAGDYSAIVFVGFAHDGRMFVDASLERRHVGKIVRDMMEWCTRYKPDYVGIEAVAFQELLLEEFKRQCQQSPSTRWSIHPIDSRLPKLVRIRRIGEFLTNRELRFKQDSPGCRLLVDQLIDYPLAAHDDGPDALDMAIQLPIALVGGGEGRKPEENQ